MDGKTAAWVWRQLIEATPWGQKPQHLLHDRDAVYGREFRQRARRVGIDAIATPIRSPRANAVAEGAIGTLRRECLDHIIVLDVITTEAALSFLGVGIPPQAPSWGVMLAGVSSRFNPLWWQAVFLAWRPLRPCSRPIWLVTRCATFSLLSCAAPGGTERLSCDRRCFLDDRGDHAAHRDRGCDLS